MNQSLSSARFPIGIRMFNRPEYTERFLVSLLNQTLEIEQSRVICFIDGYAKSSDYFQKIPDRTQAVADLVAKYLPGAKIIQSESNQGLALALFELQNFVYQMDDSDWGIFLEDDLVLDPSYLQVLEHMIGLANQTDRVVKVAACQVHMGYLAQPPDENRKHFFLGQGTQAFAESRDFFQMRFEITSSYINSLSGAAYRHKNREKVFANLAQHGIFNVLGNNDGVLDQLIPYFKKLHVVAGSNLIDDIGVGGETSFRYPRIAMPNEKFDNPLDTTLSELQEALPHLDSELQSIQKKYFADLWQVYRRADSITHTTRFITGKLIGKIRSSLGLSR